MSADRMVLGIRGQVSELERDSSVHRMVEARWNKARRGEVFPAVPAGNDVEEAGEVSISSDETVADAIRLVFGKLDELGTARQVFVWWQQEGRPRGPFAAARTGAVTAGGAWWWAIGARRLAGRERAQELLIADVGSILQ